MTYSCAVFSRGATTLEEAQETEARARVHEARRCKPGERVLDVGCGWGSFADPRRRATTACRSPASRSREPQAELARERVAEAGVADRSRSGSRTTASSRDEPFDAIASIGMVEHVGANQIDLYAAPARAACCAPAGGCSTTASPACATATPRPGPFSERYVFPDAAPLHLSRILLALERAGLRRPTTSRASRATTPRRCAHWTRAASTSTSTRPGAWPATERVRVWRLYLRAARNGFETGFTSIYQVRCRRA